LDTTYYTAKYFHASAPLRELLVALSAMLFLACIGCGPAEEAPPKVFPVKGVVKKKGGAPLEGGMIELRLEANPTFAMSSAIGADGSFQLHTLFGARKLDGGAAGACRVAVYAISNTGELLPYTLAQPLITIEEKANELTIEVD
jgi:hypothetical protein